MKQWFISHIFIFCMFSHRILFYKSPFQWDWVHSSCSELPAQETGYPNMVGTFMLSFVFPPDIFKHFFKSKVGVFLVKRAQLKKKKRWRLFFHFNRVDKNYQIFHSDTSTMHILALHYRSQWNEDIPLLPGEL